MPNIMDSKSETLSFLFKGEPASGKSPAAASFPNCYIFDFESRPQSIKQFWGPRGKKDIDYDTYLPTDFVKFDKMLDKLIARCPYETVVFDTLTSLSDIILRYVLAAKGDARAKDSKAPAGKFIGAIELNTIEDYGAEASALTDVVMAMRAIKCRYKILVAHVVRTEAKDLNGRSTVTRALLTAGKKVAAKLPGYFDEIYHFSARPAFGSAPPEFLVHTAGTGDDFARTTIGLPYELNITGQGLYDIIKPALDENMTEVENVTATSETTQTKW